VSIDDLFEAARQHGVERVRDIRLAVLETNGQISFFTRDEQRTEEPAETPET
jgi:uncharacterized membrane protein YcaP (DUF421 family)